MPRGFDDARSNPDDAAVGTERFEAERLIFTIRDSTTVHREEVAELFEMLHPIGIEEAEHIVAVSGEDERAYGPRPINYFLGALFTMMDEFLADDDGGYHEMAIHATRHARWPQAVELWFQVRAAGAPTSVWFRHLVMRLTPGGAGLSSARLDGGLVYASIGGRGDSTHD